MDRLRRVAIVAGLLLAGGLLSPKAEVAAAPPASGASSDAPFELWVRLPGQYAGGTVHQRNRLQSIDLNQLALQELERVDVQYGTARRYRGVSLAQVIEQYRPPVDTDLALIHCANGMIVPVPFRDRAAMTRLDVLVATAIWKADPTGQGGRWVSRFPAVRKKSQFFLDRRPTTFFGTKLVVSSPWHPYLKPGSETSFSPWIHTDTPVGIEFVKTRAYDRQFEPAAAPASPVVQTGREVFRTTCQFCHGARDVGAKFGWDFVEPLPLFTWRRPENLYFHVTLRRADAPAVGLMMPSLKHLSPDEVRSVWEYMRALSSTRQPAYKP